MQAEDLKRRFGLKIVTSSLEKKAETAVAKAKLDRDSTRVLVAASLDVDGSDSERDVNSDHKRLIRPSVAYGIAATAASYVQSRAKDILSIGSESQLQNDGQDVHESRDRPQEEGGGSPCVYKSEVAAFMAASTMTTVVAAGENEKLEAAKNLQSLHSSPCEWFICDDSSTYTRCFVIQVTS